MKWWFSDYDGTINLEHNDTIDPRDLDFINRWIENGNSFSIATGRMPHEIEAVLDKAKVPYNYIICNNGAVIYEKGKGIILNTPIPMEERQNIIKLFKKLRDDHILGYCLLDQRRDYSKVPVEEIDSNPFLSFNGPHKNNFEEGEKEILNSKDLNLLYIYLRVDEAEPLKKIVKEMLPNCKVVRTHKNILEIMHPKVSKGDGIERIRDLKHFDYKDVVTSGDGENDIEMLDVTNHSFAMSNHQPNVEKRAKHIIDNVFEIEKYIKF
ncbi:HAD superfamily hydrolase [Spiroplasma helicoides]|uniref:HAD superfamily hydrolase n=1 Tax=Spiroplasma helicoides TaxID=216938 RepID=A0A1B3SJ89_9MOLU|nr:Cof-type HAD-IIB family hydrolase [Spiroplasma helicoides]AOG59996.1 HAD superfamily hydrolase [Spiroplasma helicoides]